jgi:hypothetical protein
LSFEQRVEAAFEEMKIRQLAGEKFDEWMAERSRPADPPAEPLTSPNGAEIPANLAANAIARQILAAKGEAPVDAAVHAEWEATISERQDKQQAMDSYPGAESMFDWAKDFERDEKLRKVAARRLLDNAVDQQQVKYQTGLTDAEVREVIEDPRRYRPTVIDPRIPRPFGEVYQ